METLWTRTVGPLSMLTVALCAVGTPRSASAQEQAQDVVSAGNPTLQAVADGAFSPLTMTARVGSTAALAWGLGGYDTSRKGALLDSIVEVRLWGPLALRGGATYSNSTNRMRPTIGARVQLLNQQKHGVDGSVTVFYKPEGFTEAEGEIETTVALSHAFESFTFTGNLVYGQDPEGNERDGEVRATAFHQRGRLSYGLDARTRHALGTQHGKAATTEPKLDAVGGPSVTCALGAVVIFAEAGPSIFNIAGVTQAGLAAFGGLGAAF